MNPTQYAHYGADGMSYAHGPFGWVFGLIVIALIIFVIVRMVRGGGCCHHRNRNAALDVLAERFARGEIDATEYEERRKTLKN